MAENSCKHSGQWCLVEWSQNLVTYHWKNPGVVSSKSFKASYEHFTILFDNVSIYLNAL